MNIKNMLGLVGTGALLSFAPYTAQAVLINDLQEINTTLDASNPTYSSSANGTSFDLTDDGVPTTATVTSATVSFSLFDVDGVQDWVIATFTGGSLGGQTAFGLSAFDGALTGTVFASLNSTGILDYTLNFFGGFGQTSVLVTQGSLVADIRKSVV